METFIINLPDPDEVSKNINKCREERDRLEKQNREKFQQTIYDDIRENIIPDIERIANNMASKQTTSRSYSLNSHFFTLTNDLGITDYKAEDIFKETVKEFVKSFNKEQFNKYKDSKSFFSLWYDEAISTSSSYFNYKKGYSEKTRVIPYSLSIKINERKDRYELVFGEKGGDGCWSCCFCAPGEGCNRPADVPWCTPGYHYEKRPITLNDVNGSNK